MSNATELVKLSAAQMAEKIRSKEVSSRELTQAHLDVIEAAEPTVNAFLHVSGKEALAQADAFDKKLAAGDTEGLPELAGVPIAIKDMIVTKGIPTTAASKILEGWVPPYDATVIEKIKAAGMPILGKTNLDEFAQGSSTEHSAFGNTHNPWDATRVPGGSGGGSASAVGSYEAPLALGTDTGGSIRQPGAFTGTVGVKPTYGGVSRYGAIAMASSLDQIGPCGRTVLDTALLHEVIGGKSTPKDLETMLQLNYLYFTNIKKDEKSYASLMTMLETMLKNQSISPDKAFSDSIKSTLYAHNPRFESFDIEDIKDVNYDRILQIAKERTANAADFTFMFVGNFDEATLRPLIEQYIASLPATGKKENWNKVSTYAQGKVVNKFKRKMDTPKANAYIYWFNNTAPATLENSVKADAAGHILSMIYLKKIREDASAAYSAGAVGFSSIGGDVPFTTLMGVCPMKPEKADLAIKIMKDEVEGMAKTVDADMLTKVKETMLKQADDNAKKNGYWINAINDLDENGIDTVTDYKKIISALTPESLAKFVKDVIIGGGNSVEVIMLPEE